MWGVLEYAALLLRESVVSSVGLAGWLQRVRVRNAVGGCAGGKRVGSRENDI